MFFAHWRTQLFDVTTLPTSFMPTFDAFLSYSAQDKATAEAACAALEGAGLKCWIAPRDIFAGQEWSAAIVEGIENSQVLVLLFSANANTSKQVLREVERAVAKGIPILPFRLAELTPTKALEYFISSHHWLDAYPPPLEAHFQRLEATIRQLKGQIPAELSPAQNHLPPSRASTAASPARRKCPNPQCSNSALLPTDKFCGVCGQAVASHGAKSAIVETPPPQRVRDHAVVAASTNLSLKAAPLAPHEMRRIKGLREPAGIHFADLNPAPGVPNGASYAPNSVAFGDPSGTTAVSFGEDGVLRKWDLASVKELWSVADQVSNYYCRAAVSRSGKYIASCGDGLRVRLWNAQGQEIRQFTVDIAQPTSSGFSPNEQYLFAILNNHSLAVWNLQTGKECLTTPGAMPWLFPTGSRRIHAMDDDRYLTISCAAFSPDGTRVLTGTNATYTESGTVHFWEFPSGRKLREFRCSGFCQLLEFAPLGNWALVGDAEGAKLHNLATGECRKLGNETGKVCHAAFSPDGKRVLFAFLEDRDFSLRLWDVQQGSEIARFVGHQGQVRSIAFAPDGHSALSASKDATVRQWRLPE